MNIAEKKSQIMQDLPIYDAVVYEDPFHIAGKPERVVKQVDVERALLDVLKMKETVIHCKDCRHWIDYEAGKTTEDIKLCDCAYWFVGANAYCVYGELKDVH